VFQLLLDLFFYIVDFLFLITASSSRLNIDVIINKTGLITDSSIKINFYIFFVKVPKSRISGFGGVVLLL
jgi:hypothetical protein